MGRRGVTILFAALTLAAFGATFGMARLLPGGTGAALGATAAAACVGLAWLASLRLAAVPARRLARGLRAVLKSRSPDTVFVPVSAPLLDDLPEVLDAAVTALRSARRDARKTVHSEVAQVDAQKRWLEAILQGLTEGVFVCNVRHRIMLYNSAAVRLLGAPDQVGLGRSLGDLIALTPLRHSLARLEARHADDPNAPSELSAPFVCTTVDRAHVYHGRMALLTDSGGAVSGYLVTLVDIAGELALLAKGDGVRRALTRDLRGMVRNRRAAADTMAANPAMAIEDRGI